MPYRLSAASVLSIGVILMPASDVVAGETAHETRTIVRSGDDGMRTVEEITPARVVARAPWDPAIDPPMEGSGVEWTRNLTAAIYTTTGISLPTGKLVAGTYLNPPIETQLYPLLGAGVTDWEVPGARVEVAAARDADVVASVDFAATETITVRKWHTGSSTPDWTATITESTLAAFRSIVVSADGSTVAVLVSFQGGENIQARVHLYDAATGASLGTVEGAEGFFARNVSITDDGSLVAFIALATVYVFETDTLSERYSVGAGASNDPIAISGDGTYLAYGWSSLTVRQWDGATYAFVFSRSGAGHFLASVAISSDSGTLAAGWYESGWVKNRIELHDLPSSTPAWTYDYATSSGVLQELPKDIAVTATGSHVAVGSWGDQADLNDEVHVFEHAGPTPVLTVNTPGSMFDVDIARAPGGVIHVSAAGKHVHANITGSGGDLYSIVLQTDCVADIDGDGAVGFQDLLRLLAAWGPCVGCLEDVDGDDDVDFQDLLLVLAAWGPC
jgi:WD40 repeat protein